METIDLFTLLHPAIAVIFVFPIIGIVSNRALLTRQRRLQTSTEGGKSKIPPVVGSEHVQLGRWLTGSVVGLTLLGLSHPITTKIIIPEQLWTKDPIKLIIILLMFAATITSLVFLYKAQSRLWRSILATLTSLGIIIIAYIDHILGFGSKIFRRDNEWYLSHYYYGLIATILMIIALAIVTEIYKDKSQTWRKFHIILSCLALLFFLGQGMTGVRDLLEIPLNWQEPFVYSCNFEQKTCPKTPNTP